MRIYLISSVLFDLKDQIRQDNTRGGVQGSATPPLQGSRAPATPSLGSLLFIRTLLDTVVPNFIGDNKVAVTMVSHRCAYVRTRQIQRILVVQS